MIALTGKYWEMHLSKHLMKIYLGDHQLTQTEKTGVSQNMNVVVTSSRKPQDIPVKQL